MRTKKTLTLLLSIWVGLVAFTSSCGSDSACKWNTLFAQLDRSVLSVSGRSESDIFMVGGGLGVGTGPLAFHYNGSSWSEIEINTQETLWWVWVDPLSNETWMVGSGGLVVRWDGISSEIIPTETSTTFYGVWGTSKNNIWIVGGTAGAGVDPKNDYILHWNGAEFTKAEITEPRGKALFKIWGSDENNVWASGENGTLYQYKDGKWSDHSIETRASLFTIHGCSENEIYAVGAQELYFFDGKSWEKREDVEIVNVINGVYCGDDEVLIVGMYGQKYRMARSTNTWNNEQLFEPWNTHFHGAWISPEGTLWAVGGDYISPTNRDGLVAAHGCSLSEDLFQP